MEINNHCEENYNLPCLVIMVGDVKVENSEVPHYMLNGFSDDTTDYSEFLPDSVKKYSKRESYMHLMWNNADEKLYAFNKFVFTKPPTEDELEEIGKKVKGQWSDGAGEAFEQTPVMEWEEKEVFVSPWHKDQKIYISVVPIELPKDHYWLGSVF